jgi:hypothetical protein
LFEKKKQQQQQQKKKKKKKKKEEEENKLFEKQQQQKKKKNLASSSPSSSSSHLQPCGSSAIAGSFARIIRDCRVNCRHVSSSREHGKPIALLSFVLALAPFRVWDKTKRMLPQLDTSSL